MDQTYLNDALVALGLPEGQILKISTGDSVILVTSNWNSGGVAGVVIAFLVLVAGVLVAWLKNHKNESDDERLLRPAIEALRKRLGICRQDGFYLSYEAGPLWHRRKRFSCILRNEIEAAARLSLTQDFDVKSFNAFCHCIEYSSFSMKGESRFSLKGGGAEQPMSQQYNVLCDWLLEISRNLIEPEILTRWRDGKLSAAQAADKDLESGMLESERQGAAKQQFVYFKKRVAQVRLWMDHDRLLWHRLKRVAMDYMGEIARICDMRFDPRRLSNRL